MSETLLSKLKQLQNEIKDGLISSPPQTLEGFHEKVGRVRGLEAAIEAMLDLMRPEGEDDN